MSAESTIVLVGMPGSGKSTVGRHLSRRLGVDFFDSDQEVERRLNCSIRSYFEAHGEAAFRTIESEVIDELTLRSGLVLATGGGAVLSSSNREILRTRTDVLYLHSLPEGIIRRVRHDRTRPLLQVEDPLSYLKDIYLLRDPFYREISHFIVEASGATVAALVVEIVAWLENRRPTVNSI